MIGSVSSTDMPSQRLTKHLNMSPCATCRYIQPMPGMEQGFHQAGTHQYNITSFFAVHERPLHIFDLLYQTIKSLLHILSRPRNPYSD